MQDQFRNTFILWISILHLMQIESCMPGVAHTDVYFFEYMLVNGWDSNFKHNEARYAVTFVLQGVVPSSACSLQYCKVSIRNFSYAVLTKDMYAAVDGLTSCSQWNCLAMSAQNSAGFSMDCLYISS